MEKVISVDITPDKTLIRKIGQAGYSTANAIAELLDNSIDARIEGREEKITVALDFEGKRVRIRDDGRGMGRDELATAMTVASSTKPAKALGQFGIGLKSSCSSLGGRFEIRTSPEGSGREYRATYDEAKWESDSSAGWSNFKILEKRLERADHWHGTLITIDKLKVPLYPNQVTKLKKSFGARYGPYLADGQVSIRINSAHCRQEAHEVEKGSRVDVDIPLPGGSRIRGHLELLKMRSIGGRYGIDLYRHDRLIRPNVKFGFPAHPNNAKMVGRLDLDHVPVNFQKNDFITESREYREALHKFTESAELRGVLRASGLRAADGPPVESAFGFFLGGPGPFRMAPRMGAGPARELLEGTGPFEARSGGETLGISVKPSKGGPLYAVSGSGKRREIVINSGSAAFGYVKNPLFLIGLIAAEARLMRGRALEDFVRARNELVEECLKGSAMEPKGPPREGREVPIPDIPGYRLEGELVDLHDYLKENVLKKFQFTAMSTLVPYLHNFRGKIVYTLHAPPGRGEDVAYDINSEFGSRFVALDRPDRKALSLTLKNPNNYRIIAVREYEVIRGSTVAAPEKAVIDLIRESDSYGAPIGLTEIRRMIETMARLGLIDLAAARDYAKSVKKLPRLEEVLAGRAGTESSTARMATGPPRRAGGMGPGAPKWRKRPW